MGPESNTNECVCKYLLASPMNYNDCTSYRVPRVRLEELAGWVQTGSHVVVLPCD